MKKKTFKQINSIATNILFLTKEKEIYIHCCMSIIF